MRTPPAEAPPVLIASAPRAARVAMLMVVNCFLNMARSPDRPEYRAGIVARALGLLCGERPRAAVLRSTCPIPTGNRKPATGVAGLRRKRHHRPAAGA